MSTFSSTRRDFLRSVGLGAAALTVTGCKTAFRKFANRASGRPNILLITADDMNWDTPGCYGKALADNITPNIDRLAAEGMRFNYAHVTVAACQPCRSSLMTGRYPHRNGAEGFEPIHNDIPTLTEQLHKAGYINGIFTKAGHLAPDEKFCWSVSRSEKAMAFGRDPKKYYQLSKEFFQLAKKNDQPFFLMANSSDPHRPLFEDGDEPDFYNEKQRQEFAQPSRIYKSDEITMPGFLPDIPVVREDVRRYYCSARRCDDTVGEILRALRECGREKDTLVMFISDHGMPFPFAKANCYLNSTRVPWLVRWPGVVKAEAVDNRHFISVIDFMPTILDAVGLGKPEGMDGFSFVPLLLGKRQKGRDKVFTQFHEGVARKRLPMRCVQNRKYGYIFNPWSDGEKFYSIGYTNRTAWKAMVAAAETDPDIAARVEMFKHRTVEEFYDFENDPDALHNLINEPKYSKEIDKMRQQLLAWMEHTNDPALEAFRNRHRPEVLKRFVECQEAESKARGKRLKEEARRRRRDQGR